MFGSDVLEVGIGMALLFLFMSLIATAVRETGERYLKARSKDLYRGITELLRDGETVVMVQEFYEHPLIAGLYDGDFDAAEGAKKLNLPSYIPRESFALAALDLASKVKSGSVTGIRTLQSALQAETAPNKLQKVVLLALQDASGNYDQAKKTIEDWFDATMDRVSGWYVRRTGWWLFVIGLLSAIAFNVDAIAVAKRLQSDDDLRRAVVAAAANPPAAIPATAGGTSRTGDDPSATLTDLTRSFRQIGFPIGWTWVGSDFFPYPSAQACGSGEGAAEQATNCKPTEWSGYISIFCGWLITALAIMLGAPFWFDVLDKFMSVRSTIRPKEKSPNSPPPDGVREPESERKPAAR